METVKEMCGDNRFEVIRKAKEHLLEATNIESSPDEMKVLDSFLFRAWQMEWLRKYDPAFQNATDTNVGDKWVSVDEPPTKEGWYHVAILDMKTGKYKVENDLYAIEIAKAHKHEPGFCKANRWPERDKITHWCPYPQPPKGE